MKKLCNRCRKVSDPVSISREDILLQEKKELTIFMNCWRIFYNDKLIYAYNKRTSEKNWFVCQHFHRCWQHYWFRCIYEACGNGRIAGITRFGIHWSWIIAGLFSLFGALVLLNWLLCFPKQAASMLISAGCLEIFGLISLDGQLLQLLTIAAVAAIAFMPPQYAEYFFTLPRFSPATGTFSCMSYPFMGEFILCKILELKYLPSLLLSVY